MNPPNPINPRVLQWARTTAGLSVEQVVKKMSRKKITAELVLAWESGDEAPDYIQLERLAYEVYKRPLAIFFFPTPPPEETPHQAFRTLPDSEIQRLSPRMRFLLRQARAMQINLDELYAGVNPAAQQILRDIPFSLDMPVADLSRAVRQFLGVELSEQIEWGGSEEAFKNWRNMLEMHGVFVFKDAFKDEKISGFCLHDSRFPLIYVNNSTSFTRQNFTLFHELAHLISGTGGIDTPDDAYIRSLDGSNRQVEILCNQFASEFLVPDTDFDQRISKIVIDEHTIRELAQRYHVSREVVMRRLLDKHLISPQYYEQMVAQWQNQGRGKRGEGGDYYRTKGAYLGERYLDLVFSSLYQKKISENQLADYLGVKAENISGMEALIFPKGAAA